MAIWQLEDAQAKLDEVVDAAEKNGPQVIARRGVETAVIVPIKEWREMQPGSNEALFKVLQAGSHFDIPIPPRGRQKHRKPIEF